jgi:hypothetical protein
MRFDAFIVLSYSVIYGLQDLVELPEWFGKSFSVSTVPSI